MSANTLVSIGLPIYNGVGTIDRAIRSLLGQTHANLELIISDNASDDGSGAICRGFADADSRVTYFRHPANVGPAANFRHTIDLARAEFFMWAAHDDWWHPEFIEATLWRLQARPDVIACISRVACERNGVPVPIPGGQAGTYPLLGSPAENVTAYFRDPGLNSRIYALFRRSILSRCLDTAISYAADWDIVVKTLEYGKYDEVDRVLFTREVVGSSSHTVREVNASATSLSTHLFPLLPLTRTVLGYPFARRTPALIVYLILQNGIHSYMYHRELLRRYSPFAASLLPHRVGKRLTWKR